MSVRSSIVWIRYSAGTLAYGAGLMFVTFLSLQAMMSDTPFPIFVLFMPGVALGLVYVTRIGGLTQSEQFFPATDRERAWLPIALQMLLVTTGLAGLLSAQMICIYRGTMQPGALVDYWTQTAKLLSCGVLLALLFRTRWTISSPAGIVLWVGCVCNPSSHWYVEWWLLWLALSLLLILEAPHQVMAQRTLSLPRVFNEPMQKTFLTRLVDAILLLAVVAGSAAVGWNQLRNVFSPAVLILPIAVLAFLLRPALALCSRINRANGMGPAKALGACLLEMTLVGYAFRDRLGIHCGTPVQCETCGNWRMVWEGECARCAETERLDRQQIRQTASQTRNAVSHGLADREPWVYFFRVKLPIIVIGAITYIWWPR